MQGIDYNTLGITLVTILGSAGAWQFYSKRMELKSKEKKEEKSEHTLYRDDLRERVAILESKLDDERQVNTDCRAEITKLKEDLAQYKVRLEYLEKENLRLMAKAGEV